MTYFVCLDSCVLITSYIRLRSGGKLKGFDELKSLIEAKNATLVVPQVTFLELEKFVNNAERDLLSTVAKFDTLVGNQAKTRQRRSRSSARRASGDVAEDESRRDAGCCRWESSTG